MSWPIIVVSITDCFVSVLSLPPPPSLKPYLPLLGSNGLNDALLAALGKVLACTKSNDVLIELLVGL